MFISPEAMLEHWQGHRRLTRRVIAAFPEDQLFTFSIGGMRTFGSLSLELLSIGVPMLKGIATDQWDARKEADRVSKDEILRRWDEDAKDLDRFWTQIPPQRFGEERTAFGQDPGKVHDLVLYAIDNEIHHRGQGVVYLRALGIEPPPFYERHAG